MTFFTDTDSVIFATHHPSFGDCLKVDDSVSRARLSALFEVADSNVHQTGLLKDEGTFTSARIRSCKSYLLGGKLSPEVRRMRSVPRSVQNQLSDYHFGQDPELNAPVARSTVMRPTPGLDVAIMQESRRLSHSLNFKMASVVSAAAALQNAAHNVVHLAGPGEHAAAAMSVDKRLEDHFMASAKMAVVLTPGELEDYAKKKGIPYNREELRHLRQRFEFSAVASHYNRPKHLMTATVSRYGLCHLDLGVFYPANRSQNLGHGAFLLAAEVVSQQICIVPCLDGTTASWEKAVKEMAESGFGALRVIYSDRDTAVKSQIFRDRVKEKYGISWKFLKNRNKVRAFVKGGFFPSLTLALAGIHG